MGYKRILLNSKGLNTKVGCKQIKEKLLELAGPDLTSKTIYIVSYPEYEVDEIILENCITEIEFKRENIRLSGWQMPDYKFTPDFVYVTEGNTFEILNYMRRLGICDYIKKLVYENEKNLVYVGSSAGAAIAGSDIMLAKDFDSNFVGMFDYTALGLFNGAIIPHYTKENLNRYIACTGDHILERYPVIYSVSNEEVIVLDIQ